MHLPVLKEDFLNYCQGMDLEPQHYLDCTFGRGGHFEALLDLYPNIEADLIDQDLEALSYGEKEYSSLLEKKQIHFHHTNFMQLKNHEPQSLKGKKFDIILADLGVSSPQLDESRRGFSFYQEGPLDMRMDTSAKEKASDIVNSWSENDLVHLFQSLGEVRNPSKVVKNIVEFRKENEFKTTTDLSEMIAKTLGWRKKGSHPATKYFLALRMRVNNEIAPLEESVEDLIHRLKPYGRLMFLTFHSMEDRIVKWTFKKYDKDLGKIITKKAVQAKWEEKKKNPRARSAILRVFERGAYDNEIK